MEQDAVFYGSLIKQDKMRETVIPSQYDPSKEQSVFRDEDWKIKDFNKKTFLCFVWIIGNFGFASVVQDLMKKKKIT